MLRRRPQEMQDEAIACAIVAIERFAEENKITSHIKGVFEKKYSPYWHCICGRNFGAYVTHEAQNYIYFYIGQAAILLFKSG